MSRSIKVDYYDSFHCLGGECRYTCCQGWRIDFTKQEYLRYKNSATTPKLRHMAKGAFKRLKPPFNDIYAHIVFREEDGLCPFLDEEGWCAMQREHGAKALPRVCTEFPRKIFTPIANGENDLFFALSSGCEAVVWELYNRTEPLGFVMDKNEYTGAANDLKNCGAGAERYLEILELSVDILQSELYTLPQRMVVLGFVMGKLSDAAEGGHDLEPTIRSLAGAVQDPELFKPLFVRGTPEISVKYAAMQLETTGARTGKPYEYVKLALDALGIERSREGDRVDITIDPEQYAKMARLRDKRLAERPLFVENMMVNMYLYDHMPFAEGCSIWDRYVNFVMNYNMLMVYLAGVAELEEMDFIEAVTSFFRRRAHASQPMAMLHETLEVYGGGELANIALMLAQEE